MLDEGAEVDAQEAAIITEYNDLCKLLQGLPSNTSAPISLIALDGRAAVGLGIHA